VAVTVGESIYLVLVNPLTGQYYCTCPAYHYRTGPCKHVVATLKLFTEVEVEVYDGGE